MTEPIVLQVGDRTFRTDKSTLLEIPYFKGFFSEAMGSKPGPDGAYFVDLDGNVFEHVLNYARHRTFPLFWTQADGFDYAKYSLLARQADFLNLECMATWIKNRGFTKAVEYQTTIQLSVVEVHGSYTTTAPHHRVIEYRWVKGRLGGDAVAILIETTRAEVRVERLVDA
ncbi:hypothetical protein MMC10_007324 [Thelotrema lepadinum]|nr:hypothetical protein [Thelotrema lepadinum]